MVIFLFSVILVPERVKSSSWQNKKLLTLAREQPSGKKFRQRIEARHETEARASVVELEPARPNVKESKALVCVKTTSCRKHRADQS